MISRCFFLFLLLLIFLITNKTPQVLADEDEDEEEPLIEIFRASRDPFEDILNKIPQFIFITFDGVITPTTHQIVQDLLHVKERNGCNIKSTFYVSIEQEPQTQCEYVNALRRGLNEIGTNTMDNIGFPDLNQIQSAIQYLHTECNIPIEELRGFRAPYNQYDIETLETLANLGIMYDASVPMCDNEDNDNEYGSDYQWPFTFDEDSIDDIESCDDVIEFDDPIIGINSSHYLWEVPMYTHYYDEDLTTKSILMDYWGDVKLLFETNLQRRLNGNRAPMGIYLHASWMQSNGPILVNWVQSVIERYDDVHFVTTYELLR